MTGGAHGGDAKELPRYLHWLIICNNSGLALCEFVNLSPKNLYITTTIFTLPVLEFSIPISLALMISADCLRDLERAIALYINFFEVVIILGVTVVRGPDHSTFIFSRL